MYPTSAAFKAALARGFVAETRADVLSGGQLIRSGLPVIGGTVNVDGTASVRRSVTGLQLVDPDGSLTVTQSSDLLAPYGNEIRLYKGISAATLGTSADEMVPLGVFRISESGADNRSLGVTMYDRARSISRSRLTDVYVIGLGQNVATAIADLLDFILPGVTGDRSTFATTAETTPLAVLTEDTDPWERAQDMAASIGMDLWFGVDGLPWLQPVVDPSSAAPTSTYYEGDGSTLLDVHRAFSDEPGYNGFVMFGESTSNATPVRGVAWDTDPNSPTYYLGDYGQVPKIEHSEWVTTQSAADAAAAAGLVKNIGGTELLDYAIVTDPSLEANDVHRVIQESTEVDSVVVLESFGVPLDISSDMQITTRRRRVTS